MQKKCSSTCNVSKNISIASLNSSHGALAPICCRPEVTGGSVFGCDVKAAEGYVMVNSEVASYSIFRGNREKYFLTLKLAPVALTLFVADRK